MNILLLILFALSVREPLDCLIDSGFYTRAALVYAASIGVKHIPLSEDARFSYNSPPPTVVWVDYPFMSDKQFCLIARHEYGHAFDHLYGWPSKSPEFRAATRNYGMDSYSRTLRIWDSSLEKYAAMNSDYPCSLYPYSRFFPQFDWRAVCKIN